jgi:hypothetical protein
MLNYFKASKFKAFTQEIDLYFCEGESWKLSKKVVFEVKALVGI